MYDLSCTFLLPCRALIDFLSIDDAYVWHGFLFAFSLYVVAMIRTLVFQQYWQGCNVTGMRLRTAVIGVVYRKVRFSFLFVHFMPVVLNAFLYVNCRLLNYLVPLERIQLLAKLSTSCLSMLKRYMIVLGLVTPFGQRL